MTDTVSVLDEFQTLEAEYTKKEVGEAVEKAKALVESAKKRAKSVSWRKALEKLLLKYWRYLPQTLVDVKFEQLGNRPRPTDVRALSLDPINTKYWVRDSVIYERYHDVAACNPTDLQPVYLAVVQRSDLQGILEVIEAVREHDLSSQYFVPQGTAVLECECTVQKERGSTEMAWLGRRGATAVYVHNPESAVAEFRSHYCRNVPVRAVVIRLPGLNQTMDFETDEEGLPIVRRLTST